MINLAPESKASFLVATYQEIHTHIRGNEIFENKVAFASVSLFLLFSGLVMRDNIELDPSHRAAAATFVALSTGIAVRFLSMIGKRIKTLFRMLVSIEKNMGLHKPEYFWQEEQDRAGDIQIPTTALPKEATEPLLDQSLFYGSPHIAAVVAAGLLTLAVIALG